MAPWAAWPVSATNSNLWGGVPTWQVEFLHQNPLTTNDLQQPYGESNTLLTLTSTVEKMSLFLQVEDWKKVWKFDWIGWKMLKDGNDIAIQVYT